MTPSPAKPVDEAGELASLSRTFDVSARGDDDTGIGMNVLAAMAITLANVSRTGSGISKAGVNFLTNWRITTSLVRDKVVGEVWPYGRIFFPVTSAACSATKSRKPKARESGRWSRSNQAVRVENSLRT